MVKVTRDLPRSLGQLALPTLPLLSRKGSYVGIDGPDDLTRTQGCRPSSRLRVMYFGLGLNTGLPNAGDLRFGHSSRWSPLTYNWSRPRRPSRLQPSVDVQVSLEPYKDLSPESILCSLIFVQSHHLCETRNLGLLRPKCKVVLVIHRGLGSKSRHSSFQSESYHRLMFP